MRGEPKRTTEICKRILCINGSVLVVTQKALNESICTLETYYNF
jgi:hypothetical protein